MGRHEIPVPPDDLLVIGAETLGLRLNAEQCAAFRTYREELLRWAARTSLTALRTPHEIVRAGFLDSLGCAPLIPSGARRALDVGSGSGFPALPLKLVRPDLAFTLVEASRKKCTFLRHIVRNLGMADVSVLNCRVEALSSDPHHVGAYDVAFARAVAPPPEQARLVRPFLRPGGSFLLQVGVVRASGQTPADLLGPGYTTGKTFSLPDALGRSGRRVLEWRRIA
jgi:16S rRNA (guanine527-N7)-methyltransferase